MAEKKDNEMALEDLDKVVGGTTQVGTGADDTLVGGSLRCDHRTGT
jgi:hypothetical protein